MTPRKRKESKTTTTVEELPEVTVNVLDDQEAETLEKIDGPEESEEIDIKEQTKSKEPREDKMRRNIEKIQGKEGIIGYILRNSKSASIDLSDPSKVIDYAILSSSAFEASEELCNAFELGEIKHVLIEGSNVKVLSVASEESKVSVFMETNANHNRIYKDLRG